MNPHQRQQKWAPNCVTVKPTWIAAYIKTPRATNGISRLLANFLRHQQSLTNRDSQTSLPNLACPKFIWPLHRQPENMGLIGSAKPRIARKKFLSRRPSFCPIQLPSWMNLKPNLLQGLSILTTLSWRWHLRFLSISINGNPATSILRQSQRPVCLITWDRCQWNLLWQRIFLLLELHNMMLRWHTLAKLAA